MIIISRAESTARLAIAPNGSSRDISGSNDSQDHCTAASHLASHWFSR